MVKRERLHTLYVEFRFWLCSCFGRISYVGVRHWGSILGVTVYSKRFMVAIGVYGRSGSMSIHTLSVCVIQHQSLSCPLFSLDLLHSLPRLCSSPSANV